MDNEGQHFPNRLREHRVVHGLKQKEVARLLGHVTATRISKWESGKAAPGLLNIIRLSIIYAAQPTDLYFDMFKQQEQLLTNVKRALLFDA